MNVEKGRGKIKIEKQYYIKKITEERNQKKKEKKRLSLGDG